MAQSIAVIPLANLALAFLPAGAVLILLYLWSLDCATAGYALGRMVLQLLAIGYVLTFIFNVASAWPVMAVLTIMLLGAGWISIRPLTRRSRRHFLDALAAIALGGIVPLWLATAVVLEVPRWYEPHVVIPLAGMVFSNCMNAVSLAAERFQVEHDRGAGSGTARTVAMNTAMIPVINSMFAVGIVSLPGMMTGQILSGVDPLVAVRYQVLVMALIFSGAGLSAAAYLFLRTRADSGS